MLDLITPAEIRQKALKFWQSGAFLRAFACGEDPFPREIRFRKPSAGDLIEHFAEIRDWIRDLKANEKETKGYGYRLVYRQVKHRQLGPQNIPAQILIDSLDDYLRLIGRQKEFETFTDLQKITATRHPDLLALFQERPLRILEHAWVWNRLLDVCDYFLSNSRPGVFIRQLEIPGFDTKFIEQHSGILSELLDRVLPPEAIDRESSGLAGHGFERRYGLLYDQPLIRLRILDPELAIDGLDDLSLPLPDFARLTIVAESIFITENKINGLAFPPFPRAVVIFGLGYGIRSLANIEWLKNRPIHYWGDIDTHGFAILSQLRGYYPQSRSMLMDRDTLETFRHLCVEEAESKRETRALSGLNFPERRLYEDLVENRLGRHLRLEQERIAFGYVKARLQALVQTDNIKND